MIVKTPNITGKISRFVLLGSLLSGLTLAGCQIQTSSDAQVTVVQSSRTTTSVSVPSTGVYRLQAEVNVNGDYAVLDVYAGNLLLANNINFPRSGKNQFNTLIQYTLPTEHPISFEVKDSDIEITQLTLTPVENLNLPHFTDISERAGIDKVSSIKYGGPTVADIDMDGDYDFIVNNHNAESSKLYWNNGDGTVSKHQTNLARWFMHDLHGTAAGDFDNDGDLDLVVTMGGGNGNNPSKANFYLNDNGNFVLYTGDVGINKGGRGRGARWIDADLDGDLDLLLHNEASLTKSKPQQYFYKNLGNSTLELVDVKGLQDVEPSRVLVTDINQDQIDDIIFYGHHKPSIWQGNGDFTYTDVSQQFPDSIMKFNDIMAMVDVDIDNDGDLDLYVARGKEFGLGDNVSMDFDAMSGELDLKPRGNKGQENLMLVSSDSIKFHKFHYQAQLGYRNKIYPMFLGKNKTLREVTQGQETTIAPSDALGFPSDISQNGMYFGVTGTNTQGEHIWQVALVRNDNIFWGFGFSLHGVSSVTPEFKLENRNSSDVLLENHNGYFVDVSTKWNIPKGGNSLGVTRGDFNNDGRQDLLVYRWGRIGKRIADLMLVNNQNKSFESYTQHGANDIGGPGNGDMGQAFDFDLDGKLDVLSGSEGGQWYVYKNNTDLGNHLTVRVGYSPMSNVDAYGAQVELFTANKSYKQRVGSAGEVFSQSLLNNVHFGLGEQTNVQSVKVTWRNGEIFEFKNVAANNLIETPQTKWFKKTKQVKKELEKGIVTKPYIRFVDEEKFSTQGLKVGSQVSLNAEFHAGTGNKVIAADEGGIRFWLRHFKYKWIPAKDIKLIDEMPLYSESGNASATLSLTGVTPSNQLPEGHFYQLRASFMNSRGEMIDTTIDNVKVFE